MPVSIGERPNTVTISFPDLSPADASLFARELEQELRKAGVPGEELALGKASHDTQDVGSLLLVAAGAWLLDVAKDTAAEAGKEFGKTLGKRAGSRAFAWLVKKWGTRARITTADGRTLTLGSPTARGDGAPADADRQRLSELKTLGVVMLGASAFPGMPAERGLDNPAFAHSAAMVRDLLASGHTIFRDIAVLDLFDKSVRTEDIVDAIEAHVATHPDMRDVLLYYCGHGAFMADGERTYYLTLRDTRPNREPATALLPKTFRYMVENHERLARLRYYWLLDCCFAGTAVKDFQSGAVDNIVGEQVRQMLPSRGWAFLTASAPSMPAIASDGHGATMFSGALADVLTGRAAGAPPRLTLADLCTEMQHHIRTRHGLAGVLPQCHAPQQSVGDVSRIAIFNRPLPLAIVEEAAPLPAPKESTAAPLKPASPGPSAAPPSPPTPPRPEPQSRPSSSGAAPAPPKPASFDDVFKDIFDDHLKRQTAQPKREIEFPDGTTDPLTGLPLYPQLLRALGRGNPGLPKGDDTTRLILACIRAEAPAGLELGQVNRDSLQLTLVRRLQRMIENNGILSPIGPGRFMVLLRGPNRGDRADSEIQQMQRRLEAPVVLAGQSIKCEVNIGAVISRLSFINDPVAALDDADRHLLQSIQPPSGPIAHFDHMLGSLSLNTRKIWSGTFGTQGQPVTAAASSVDGRQFVVGRKDGSIEIWRKRRSRYAPELAHAIKPKSLFGLVGKGHSGGITCLAISTDGTLLISGSLDGSVSCWGLADGAHIATAANAHAEGVTAIGLAGDRSRLVTHGRDGLVVQRHVPSLQAEHTITVPGKKPTLCGLALGWRSPLTVGVTTDGHAHIWLGQRPSPIHSQKLKGFGSIEPGAMASTPDLRTLACLEKGNVWTSRLDTGVSLGMIEGLRYAATALAISPDGDLVAIGTKDGTVVIHSLVSRSSAETSALEGEAITTISASAHAGAVLVGGDKGSTAAIAPALPIRPAAAR